MGKNLNPHVFLKVKLKVEKFVIDDTSSSSNNNDDNDIAIIMITVCYKQYASIKKIFKKKYLFAHSILMSLSSFFQIFSFVSRKKFITATEKLLFISNMPHQICIFSCYIAYWIIRWFDNI